MTVRTTLVLATCAAAIAAAQTKKPSFDVASIKPNTGHERFRQFEVLPGGKLHAVNVPVIALIRAAYGISSQPSRLTGTPAWARDESYDIEAQAEPGAIRPGLTGKALDAQVMPLLQNLLAERFQLQIRRESKELAAYELTVAKGGPKLEKSKIKEEGCADFAAQTKEGPTCHQFFGGMGRGLHSKAASLSDMAGFIENWTDRPVINKTGVDDLFEFDTEGWAPLIPRENDGSAEALAMHDPGRPTLFLILDRIGLKLTPVKEALDVFIVERLEKPANN